LCSRLGDAKYHHVIQASTQIVSGTNYNILAETSAGNVLLKVYEQPWTNTLELNEVTFQGGPLLGEPLPLDSHAFEVFEGPSIERHVNPPVHPEMTRVEDRPCVQNKEAICPMIYNPMCGEDGNTYSSSCHAHAACQKIAKMGPCEKLSLRDSLLLGGAPIGSGGRVAPQVEQTHAVTSAP